MKREGGGRNVPQKISPSSPRLLPFFLFQNLLGAKEGFVEGREDVLLTHGPKDADALERLAGGLLHGGEQHAAAFLTAFEERFQRMDAGHVDGGRVVQVHDEHLGRRLHRVQRGLEPVGHTEEQRTVDGENLHAVGHAFLVRHRNVVLGRLFLLTGNAGMDAGQLAHAPHEQQRGQHDAGVHGHGQVEHHRQREGQDHHRPVGLRPLEDVAHRAQIAHVVGDHHEHGGESGQRDELDERQQPHGHRHEEQGMHDGGNGRNRARPDVGRGARDGARGRETAEKYRNHVADALRNQLHVGVVPVAGHAVRHHAGQQGFDARQQGDGQRVGEQLADALEGHAVGHGEFGKARRQAAEPGTDGFGGQAEQPYRQRRQKHRHHRRGNLGDRAPDQQDDRQREQGHAERRRTEIHRVLGVGSPFVEKFRRRVHKGQAEEVLHLRREDQQGDPRGEPRGHRIGNVLHQHAQPQKAENDQQDARHQRRQDQTFVPVPGNDAVDDDDERARRPADRETAAAEKGHEEPGDDGRIQAAFRRQSRGDGEGERERDGHHAHGDARGDVLGQHPEGVPIADCFKKARNQRGFVLSLLHGAGHISPSDTCKPEKDERNGTLRLRIGRHRGHDRRRGTPAEHELALVIAEYGGDAQGHGEVENRHGQPYFKGPEVHGDDFLSLTGQLSDADDHQQGRILQRNDALIGQRRDHAPEGLRPDDVEHGLGLREPGGTPGLHLSPVDGDDGPAHDFGDVRAGVHADGDDARHIGGNPHAEGQRKAEIEEHHLNDERRSPDRLDVDDGDSPEETAPGRIGKSGDHAEEKTEKKPAHGEDQRELHPAQQLGRGFQNNGRFEVKSHTAPDGLKEEKGRGGQNLPVSPLLRTRASYISDSLGAKPNHFSYSLA